MVIFDTLRHWIFFVLLTTIFFTYLTLINLCMKENLKKTRISQYGVKKIIAYSLRKQIEIESEQYDCGQEANVYVTEGANKSVEKRKSVDLIRVKEDSTRWNDEDGDSAAWTRIENSNLYVSSVNLDKRLDPYNYIRIIAVVKGHLDNRTLYCKFPFNKGAHNYMKTSIVPIWASIWNKNDNNTYYNPVLISCRIPLEKLPTSVSLTTHPCETIENERVLKINKTRFKARKYFTVCVKPLDYLEDISERLIQWIEIIRILGAEKIEFYVKRLGRRAWNILKWYSSTFPDKIAVQKFSSIPDAKTENDTRNHNDYISQNIWQKRRFEIVAYNNCFYKNVHISHFIVPLDIDEIIIPRKGTTWKNFLKAMFTSFPELEESFASLTVPNAYYFGNISNSKNSIFFMENIRRTSYSPAGESGKSFINTKNTLTVFNHYALDTLRPGVSKAYFLPSNFIQLNHYKETCNAVILPECVKYTLSPRNDDPVMWKIKARFTGRYNRTLNKLRSLGLLISTSSIN